MKKENDIIDMEKRGNVFVPAKRNRVGSKPLKMGRVLNGYHRPNSGTQKISETLEGMVTDLFKVMRKEMFR